MLPEPASRLPITDSRRELLRLALASAGTLWLPRSARAQARFDANPFTLGVASGSPSDASIVLWTRLALPGLFGSRLGNDPILVRWEIAHDEAFRRPVQSGQAIASAELAHSVHVEVNGLAPDRWYWYRFMAGDAVSPAGRTRTFPAPDAPAARLRLAYASCQRWEHGHYGAYRHMRQEDVDAVVFLGDYIYEYPGALNAVRLPDGGWVTTLAGYRQRYAQHKSDPDLQAMHAACPWLVTWDDHEVQNDYAGALEGENGPPVADFAARRAAAYQAYYEHMPLRASVLVRALSGLSDRAEMRIHGQARFGRLATLYLLDDRQYRDPLVCSRAGRAGSSRVDPADCAVWNDPRRSLLGSDQEAWLDKSFGDSRASWNIVCQQTLFGQRDFRPGTGESLWNDGWDGYPAARTRFTDSLRRHNVNNPVLLGGDVHENWVGHVKADYREPVSASVGVEFCGTSITSRPASGARHAEWLAENPHFVFADSRHRGYGVAEFTPRRLSTTLRVIDDPTSQEPAISTLARFSVAAGRPVIERE
ncbi:MAG: alkaline phosphatase D family protein [Burkholderiaceae bacterium]|nr:alkaline phosphatase D family protein [Burkholderiaceae bacterium]